MQAPTAQDERDERSSSIQEAPDDGTSGETKVSGGGATPSGTNATTQGSCAFGEPNEEHSKAAKLELGRTYTQLCLSRDDTDFFEFTAPSAPGYATVKVQNVGDGRPNVVLTGADNAAIKTVWADNIGASVNMYVALAPGAVYRIAVRENAQKREYTYDLALSFAPFGDAYEPNDTRAQAKDIEAGKVVQGIFAAGTKTWEDWYRVSLGKGAVTVRVDDVATGILPELEFLDQEGKPLAKSLGTTNGGNVVIRSTASVAGTYFVSLSTAGSYAKLVGGSPDLAGKGNAPESFTRPYKLSVTQ